MALSFLKKKNPAIRKVTYKQVEKTAQMYAKEFGYAIPSEGGKKSATNTKKKNEKRNEHIFKHVTALINAGETKSKAYKEVGVEFHLSPETIRGIYTAQSKSSSK